MESKIIKKQVVRGYNQLAKANGSCTFTNLIGCCSPTQNADAVAKAIGYDKQHLDLAPEGANLGIGCGNPTALTSVPKGSTVIDLGSGAGFDAFIAAELVGDTGKVIGVDLSGEMISLARKNAKKSHRSNIKFVKGDIEKLPLQDEIADLIISNCVINLSTNKQDVFSEAYRVLRPGGRMSYSDVILIKDLPEDIKHSIGGHLGCIGGAERLDQYVEYMTESGFEAIEVLQQAAFPLELMMTDPQIQKIAALMDFDLSSEEARDLASRVQSMTITAFKQSLSIS